MKQITLLFSMLIALTASAATGWYNDFLTIKVNGVETTNNYFLVDASPASGASALHGANFGTVTSLELTAWDMKYWSDTQDRLGGALYYKIMNADGTTQIVAPVELIWEQVKLEAANDYQGIKPAAMSAVDFLQGLPTGTYQLHVWAKSWGSNQGDSWLSNGSLNYVANFSVYRPVIVSGANGIADNSSFATLKAAFDAINAQPDQAGKDIEVQITGNTTETASAVLNQPATANWNSLMIYPTAVATISGSFIGTIIDLNGADNVTINGRLNKTGAAKSLTISHTISADNSNRTIRLLNDAKNNTIQYATITGKCPSTGAGVIFFSTTNGADGNDDNIIEYCDINAMGEAAVAIGSAGTADKANSGNIIRNNNIFDFYLGNTSTNITYGINIGAHNTDWTISGNSLYQTQARAYSETATFHYGIFVSAATGSGGNFLISDNYIGGSEPNAGGTPWTVTGGLGRPVPLYTSVGTTTASSIQGNTIANFDITTGFISNGSSAFIGYWHAAGSVNVGTVTGNTIGSTTATGSIVVKYNSAAAGALTVGMNIVTAAAATQVFSNNKIGGITADYLNTVNRGHLYAVSTSGAGALTFTNNIIGSETVANSIEHKGSTYAAGQVNLRGITMGNIGITFTGNTIANLTASSTATISVHGIYCNGTGANNFSNNTIRDINSNGTRVVTNQGIDAGLIGICFNANSSTNTLSENNIYNLENKNTTLAVDVYGILNHTLSATGISVIEKNKIYNLKTASSNTAANVVGISITRGLTNTTNNMISLGDGITNAVSIVGIRKLGTAATQNNNFYHNTIQISGTEVGTGGTGYTAAFAKVYSATDELKNNILINSRSNATGNTQKHYVLFVNDLTTFTSDYNVAYHPGVGGLLGAVGTTDYATGEQWSAASPTGTGQDANSRVSNVNFTAPATADLTITGLSVQDVNLKVPSLAAVTTDILGTTRNTEFTYAGAHQAALPFPTTSVDKPKTNANLIVTSKGIEIRTTETTNVEIFSVNGLLLNKAKVNGLYTVALDAGVYIVRMNETTRKIVK